MKSNKRALLPGLSLFVCLGLLTGAHKLIELYDLCIPLMALLEIGCLLLPLAMALPGMEDRDALRHRLSLRQMPQGAWLLTVCMGAAAALLGLCVDLLIFRLTGRTGLNLTLSVLAVPMNNLPFAWRAVLGIVLAALFEEVYLRGVILCVQEGSVGTSMCMLFSGIIFALLHGSLFDLAGPFIMGIAFAYLTYALDCVWAAVLAHAVGAGCLVAVQWAADTYAPFGIWNILPALAVLLTLLFAFLTLHTLEGMLVRGSIPHFEVSAGWYDAWLLIKDPGFIVFVLAFAGKIVMDHWVP